MKSLATFWIFLGLFATPPKSATERPLLIRAGHLIDVESGKVSADQGILVVGSRIKSIGDFQRLKDAAPKELRLMDLSAEWVLPGFIDCHTHLLLQIDRAQPGKDALATFVEEKSKAQRIAIGQAMAGEDLQAGITTVRDLGNSGHNGDVELRDSIRAGKVKGPRMIVSTRAISGRGGQFWENSGLSPKEIADEYAEISSESEAQTAVVEAKGAGADVIKIIVDGTQLLTQSEVTAVVETAHNVGLKVAAHAISDKAVRIATEAGVDSVEHGYFASAETLELMSAKGIYLVPTDGALRVSLTEAKPPFAERYDAPNEISIRRFEAKKRETLRTAIAKGVKIAAGSDDYLQVPGMTRGEASLTWVEAYQDAGMKPMDIIKAMTVNAAKLLGLSGTTGTLQVGKTADIVAVGEDPLKNINVLEKVRFVMKEGEVVRKDAY